MTESLVKGKVDITSPDSKSSKSEDDDDADDAPLKIKEETDDEDEKKDGNNSNDNGEEPRRHMSLPMAPTKPATLTPSKMVYLKPRDQPGGSGSK